MGTRRLRKTFVDQLATARCEENYANRIALLTKVVAEEAHLAARNPTDGVVAPGRACGLPAGAAARDVRVGKNQA